MKHPRGLFLAFGVVIAAGIVAALLSAQQAGKSAGERAGAVAGKRSAVMLRESQLAGCIRTTADREDAIRGWTAAREARLVTSRSATATVRDRIAAGAAAETYRLVIDGYRSRMVDCATAFPPITL